MPLPADLFAQLQSKKKNVKSNGSNSGVEDIRAENQATNIASSQSAESLVATKKGLSSSCSQGQKISEIDFGGKPFAYDPGLESFFFAAHSNASEGKLTTPCLVEDKHGNAETDVCIPLGQCVYRMTDYTYAKKEPILLHRCVLKLGVLRCLQRECRNFNQLLWKRYNKMTIEKGGRLPMPMEEDQIGKIRFMELLSNCGMFQKCSEMILKQIGQSIDCMKRKQREITCSEGHDNHNDNGGDSNNNNPFRVPQIVVDGLDEFLLVLETELVPTIRESQIEIEQTSSVRFFPGLGELYPPGAMVTCYPEGMEGTPVGCQVIQCWYDEEYNPAAQKIKRKFVLVLEFIVSVGDELVFVAASDVYPEFHDPNRNVPIKDLKHRRLFIHATTKTSTTTAAAQQNGKDSTKSTTNCNNDDAVLLQRLQLRGEFYASVATNNHYLEYHPNSFYPIIGGGWSSNAVRPLSKGGRVMVDVKRGILEGHIPIRSNTSADGMSDTVKEAIKLFEQSKRTGVAVPFRTCILPGFQSNTKGSNDSAYNDDDHGEDDDRNHLWQSWPMLTGFSFTARVWGKLLLGMPKQQLVLQEQNSTPCTDSSGMASPLYSPLLSGVGKCGNCGYIQFQEKAFDQLVLAEDKKELIRAVARNAGGGGSGKSGISDHDDELDYIDDDDDDDDDDDPIGIDVVANKGGASIFLLHGPPGTGKTLTAEAIAELLRKPLYVVTAGDLGITASEVEKTLGSVLELCQTWDALVLIDEADIFLEARDCHEIQRNALVCVMLRLLEYYSGCLFLSSNRSASTIDAAIASRITVMLHYPPLDMHGQAKVWKNLVELIPVVPSAAAQQTITSDETTTTTTTTTTQTTKPKNKLKLSKYRMDFTEEDYLNLAKGYNNLNGRQIKNSIVLARALARERNTPLSMPIIQRAVSAVAGTSN